jgi:carbon monoxide dehydrogenase subunit G
MAKPSTMSAEIDVDAPIQAVYNQWTQFESFPHFLNAVKEVTQIDDSLTHWVVSVGGVQREFDAEITDQVPDQHIAWASVDGKSHSGSVRFAPAGAASTRVSLEMMWLPETFVEKVGAALNLDERQAKMDLERFKSFIEERGRETGGWRGEIHDAVPESGGSSQGGAWATGATAGSTATPGSTGDMGSSGYGTTEYGSGAGSDMREDDLPPSPDRM